MLGESDVAMKSPSYCGVQTEIKILPRCKAAVLLLGKEYSISGVVNLYGPADVH